MATHITRVGVHARNDVRFTDGDYRLIRMVHNPVDADHRIRWMPSTLSGPCRPVGPTDGVQFSPDAGFGGRHGSESVDGMLRNPDG